MEPLALWRVFALLAIVGVIAVVVLVRDLSRLRIAVLATACVVLFAVAQDQVSARLCVEYFTVLHPPIVGLTDPTLLGVTWGFLGAAPAAFLGGYAIGVAATVGPWPRLSPARVLPALGLGVLGMTAAVGITGFATWMNVGVFDVQLDLVAPVPVERHDEVLIVGTYHLAAYVAGVLAGAAVLGWVVWRRWRMAYGGEAAAR